MKTKKIIAGIMSLAVAGALAGCGGGSSNTTPAQATTQAPADTAAPTVEEQEAGAVTTAGEQVTAAETNENISLSISWWGGDSRHEATQKALDAFTAAHPNITIEPQFGAWSGWEEKMSTAFYAGTAPDVNQVNWNWLYNFSGDGSIFADISALADFDTSQYDPVALKQCTVANKLQAIPVSMTGRIFYWNKSTFEKAGIDTPKSLADLLAAGETFKTVLGDDYYPLAVGEYDRMILMTLYLESKYGKEWVKDNTTLNYTVEEIADGMAFIDSLEDAHVIPSIATITGDGADSLDKNPKWMEGKYAGIFEWDSSASKYEGALNEGQEFIVGEYFPDMGETHGGFAKVSLGFSICETSQHKAEAAQLLNFMLNEAEGVEIMGSERGIPLSKSALSLCKEKGILNPTVAEANAKVLTWVSFGLDPNYENAKLKNAPDGVYQDAFGGLSFDEYDVNKAAQVLYDGVTAVLSGQA